MSWLTMTVDVPEELKDAFVGEFSRDRILGVWGKTAPGNQRIELVLYFDEARTPPLVEARVGRLFERNGYPVSDVPEVRFGTEGTERLGPGVVQGLFEFFRRRAFSSGAQLGNGRRDRFRADRVGY